ncbi:TPA: conjugal transfer protein TraG N-terminal domain-containing protein [Salmonella enterica subsp. diarizonae]
MTILTAVPAFVPGDEGASLSSSLSSPDLGDSNGSPVYPNGSSSLADATTAEEPPAQQASHRRGGDGNRHAEPASRKKSPSLVWQISTVVLILGLAGAVAYLWQTVSQQAILLTSLDTAFRSGQLDSLPQRIPVLLMFSAYDPKTIVTITFSLFALMFIPFWWEVAGWLDDQLLTIMYGARNDSGLSSSVPFADFVGSVNDGWIMNLVLGVMYILFPLSWFGMLSWTGVRLGDFATQMVNNGAKLPQTAGNEGGKQTKDAAVSVITKGNRKLK